jgi:hypothetical protein
VQTIHVLGTYALSLLNRIDASIRRIGAHPDSERKLLVGGEAKCSDNFPFAQRKPFDCHPRGHGKSLGFPLPFL